MERWKNQGFWLKQLIKGPQSGRLQYEITDANKKSVTALVVTDIINHAGDFKIISGGESYFINIRWRS